MNVRKATVIRAIVAVVFIAAVTAAGFYFTNLIADSSMDSYFVQRQVQASTAAAAINVDDAISLAGNASDVGTTAFQQLREQLLRIKHSDPNVRFVYLMRPLGDKLVFLVDAEDPSSPDYSPPGQVFEETKPEDLDIFVGKKPPTTEIEKAEKDRWGTWVSASAYLLDHQGKPVALLGTDVDIKSALAASNQIRRLGTIFNLVAMALLAMVGLQYILWRHNKDRGEALHREMEASMMRLNDELVKTDQMKSEFIQIASHELRGPVNAVNVAVQTVERCMDDKLGEDERTLVEIARNGSERLVDLVNNLLDLTRIEAGDIAMKPEEIDLGSLVTQTVRLFEPLAGEKGLVLSLELPAGSVDAVVDKDALLRVIENLVANGIKFTDTGEVSVKVNVEDSTIAVSVRDTGRGIPEELKGEVFKKFTKLAMSGNGRDRGSGMGLAVSRALVDAMGGRIWYYSTLGVGSEFAFELPRRAGVVPGGSGQAREPRPTTSESPTG